MKVRALGSADDIKQTPELQTETNSGAATASCPAVPQFSFLGHSFGLTAKKNQFQLFEEGKKVPAQERGTCDTYRPGNFLP